MSMWKHALTKLAAMLALIAGLAVVGTFMASPANAADCNGTVPWNAGYNDRHDNAFINDYTPQLNGPYTICGQINYGHAWTDIRTHCVLINDNLVVWAHIRNINYDSSGWVPGESLVKRVRDARIGVC